MEKRSPAWTRRKYRWRQPTIDSSDDELSSGEVTTVSRFQIRKMNPMKKEHKFGFWRNRSPGGKKHSPPKSPSPEPQDELGSELHKSKSIEDLLVSNPYVSPVQRTPHRRKKGRIKYALALTGAKLGATPVMSIGDSAQKMCSVGIQTVEPESFDEETEPDTRGHVTQRRSSQTQTDLHLIQNLRDATSKPEVVRSHSAINIGVNTDLPIPSQSNVEKAMKCLAVGSLDSAKDMKEKYRYQDGSSVDEIILPAQTRSDSLDKSSDYYSMSIGSLTSASLMNLDKEITPNYLSPYDPGFYSRIGRRKSSTGDSAVDMRMPLSDDDHSDVTVIEREDQEVKLDRPTSRASFCQIQTPSFTTISAYVPAPAGPPSVVISDHSSPVDNQPDIHVSIEEKDVENKNLLSVVAPWSDVSSGSSSECCDSSERQLSESGSSRKSSWSDTSFCSVDEDEGPDTDLPALSIRRVGSGKKQHQTGAEVKEIDKLPHRDGKMSRYEV